MHDNYIQPNHPIEDSPYRLHLFHKNEFIPLQGCCAKSSALHLTNLYFMAYNPFYQKETKFNIYSCVQCSSLYVAVDGRFKKIKNLLKYEIKQR